MQPSKKICLPMEQHNKKFVQPLSLKLICVEQILEKRFPRDDSKLPLDLCELLKHFTLTCVKCGRDNFRGIDFPLKPGKDYFKRHAHDEVCYRCRIDIMISYNGCKYCWSRLKYGNARFYLRGTCGKCLDFFLNYDQDEIFLGIRDKGFTSGNTEIWYLDGRKQNKFLNTDTITRSDIESSHHLLGKIACVELDYISSQLEIIGGQFLTMKKYREFTESIIHFRGHLTNGDVIIIGDKIHVFIRFDDDGKPVWKEMKLISDK